MLHISILCFLFFSPTVTIEEDKTSDSFTGLFFLLLRLARRRPLAACAVSTVRSPGRPRAFLLMSRAPPPPRPAALSLGSVSALMLTWPPSLLLMSVCPTHPSRPFISTHLYL